MAFADTQHLTIQLDLKGNIKQAVRQVALDLQALDKHTSNTQRSLGKLSQNLQRGIAVGAAAAAGGFIAVVKAAGDFEAQLHTINTVANLSVSDLKGVGDSLRKIATDTGLSLDDLTSGYYDLVSAGVKGTLATAALNDAVKLGIGGLATTAETVDLLTTAINAYGLDAAGAAKATDQFALAVADGKVKASEIAATFADVASIAKAYGVGIDQIAASYAFLTAQGVPASEVTTEMQRAITSLINPTKDLEAAQKKLGVSFTAEITKKGLVPALQELRLYSDKTGIPLISLLGRIEAVKYTLQTTGPNFKGFNAELGKMGDAAGTAASQMAERQQGLNFQLARLKQLAISSGITIGSALLPKITPLIEKLNAFIGSHGADIAAFGDKLASGFQNFATAVQKVDFKGIIGGLELTGRVAKTIVDAFLALPPDIQKLAVTALAINKVGGGIITSGIKDIAGLVLSRLTTIQAANVTVIGANVTGGIPGGGPEPVGTSTSLLSKVATAAALGAVVAGTIQEGKNQGVIDEAGHVNKSAFGLKNTPVGSINPADAFIKALGSLNLLGPADKASKQAELDARRVEAAENRTTDAVSSAGKATVHQLDALHKQFRADLAGLRKATKPVDIAKFARNIARDISRGVGSAAGTRGVLADLKTKLTQTHDPKTAAILRAAIHTVEAKLPNREWVSGQLDAAKKIAGSTESTKDKVADLKVIENRLRARGDTNAAKVVRNLQTVQAKVDAAKKKASADTHSEKIGITNAIKAQKLAVTIPITNITTVSLRDMTLRSRSATRLGYFDSGAGAGK